MKPLRIPVCLLISFLSVAVGHAAYAQDGVIKVTSTLHADGGRTDMQTDSGAGTGESKTYDAAGKLTQRTTYKLDERGQPAEGTVFTPKGKVFYHYTYVRDEAGRIKEEKDTDEKGNLVRRLVYQYDSKGKVIGLDAYDGQGNLLKPEAKATPPRASKKSSARTEPTRQK